MIGAAVLRKLGQVLAAAVAEEALLLVKIAADHLGDFVDRAALEFHVCALGRFFSLSIRCTAAQRQIRFATGCHME